MNQKLNVALEIKSLGAREFEGHGSIFGNVDLGGDIVIPGAFKKSLSQHKKAGSLPAMFWMHQPDKVPGIWTEMNEDEKGLYVRGELVDTPLGNEMRTLLDRKAVRGLSIGYSTIDRDFDKDGNRLLKELDLWEVSIVSLAMNPLAQVDKIKSPLMRLSAVGEYIPTARELEHSLRDVGCSKTVARHVVSRLYDDEAGGMPDLPQRKADEVDPEVAEVLKALSRTTDSLWSDVFRRG